MTTQNITGNVGTMRIPGPAHPFDPYSNTENLFGVTQAYFTGYPGTINLEHGSLWIGGIQAMGFGDITNILGSGTWINNTASYLSGTVSVPMVSGNGEIIEVGAYKTPSKLTFLHGTTVGNGQTVEIGGSRGFGTSYTQYGDVEVQDPHQFHAAVKLGAGRLELDGLHGTSYSLKNDLLSIFNGRHVVDTLHLTIAAPTAGLGPAAPLEVSQTASGISIDATMYTVAGHLLPIHGIV